MANKTLYNSDEIIEVVMKKKMSIKEYYGLLEKLRKKGFEGWTCQGYQAGYYQGEKQRKEIN